MATGYEHPSKPAVTVVAQSASQRVKPEATGNKRQGCREPIPRAFSGSRSTPPVGHTCGSRMPVPPGSRSARSATRSLD
jgi:hypothetical protein